MKYMPDNLNTTLKALIECVDFIDNEIQAKMPVILARASIPAVDGFFDAQRLDNLYMSQYIFKNNILNIYEVLEKSLNAFDLTDSPDLEHSTIINIKHRHYLIADTIRLLVENMIKLPDFKNMSKDEKYIKSQYIAYIDFSEKMNQVNLQINNYLDKNLSTIKGLSDIPNFVNIYINEISKDTYSSTFVKFGQILIKSSFDPSKFYPLK